MKCAYYLFYISRFTLLFFHMHFAVINYFFSKLLLVVTILEKSIYFWIDFCSGKNNSSVLIVIYKQCFNSLSIVPHLYWHLPWDKYLTMTYVNTKNITKTGSVTKEVQNLLFFWDSWISKSYWMLLISLYTCLYSLKWYPT